MQVCVKVGVEVGVEVKTRMGGGQKQTPTQTKGARA
jgi:hypothetical protein